LPDCEFGIGRGVAGAGVNARSGRGSDDTPTAPVPPKIGRDGAERAAGAAVDDDVDDDAVRGSAYADAR